jgi:AraC family transcriptional activator of pobA
MQRRASRSTRDSSAVQRVAFNRTKYGRDLLIDVAWVHDMPSFITTRPHALDFYDIILVTRGHGAFLLDGARHPVRAGMVFFTSPGQVRDWRVDRLDGCCLFFVDAFIREFLQDDAFVDRLPYFQTEPANAALSLSAFGARRLRARLAAMRRELESHRHDSIQLLRAQVHETLLVLARQYGATHDVPTRRTTHPLVSRFVALVERDLHQSHRVADFATELGVSPGHLTSLCHDFLGRSAKAHIDDLLATRARRMLLHTAEPAARIAAALGFEDPSYFARFFRRQTGMTPTDFRTSAADG